RRKANVYWATAMTVVLAMVVGASVIGAIALRGREQCGWIGFAVFSVLCLGLTVGDFLSDAFKDPFRTSGLLEYLSCLPDYPLIPTDPETFGAVNTEDFLRVGHCLFAFFSGLIGSVIGRILYTRRERGGTSTP